MAIPPKNSIRYLFLRRLLRQPSSASLVPRLLSLGLMTGLGWAVFNSIDLQPSPIQSLGPSAESLERPSSASELALQSALDGWTPTVASTTKVANTTTPSPANVVTSPQPLGQAVNAQVPSANLLNSAGGSSIRINGQQLPGRWQQKNGRIGIASAAMVNLLGVELMSTSVPTEQPVRWFPSSDDEVITLPAWWDATDRYLDVTDLAARAGWTGQPAGATLSLTLPQSDVKGIRQGKQTWGDRIVLDLTGPATWQIADAADGFTITVSGKITQQMVKDFKAAEGNLITKLHVAPLNGRTVLKLKLKDGASPQVWSTGNPARVVIDIRKDAMVERDVAWSPGLRWRQQYIAVGAHRFPVYMFIAQPNPSSLALRTIHARPGSAIGIEPIVTQAQTQGVAGAVNAGFFNRNNQLPLGAVRRNGEWISGPILGRGAMAWNEQGDLIMDRLALTEMARTESGENLPVLAVNSGYVQAGIARYTRGWGASYTPLIDGEIVVTVRNDQVTAQQTLGKAGTGSVAIPADGYLLTLRNNRGAARHFAKDKRVALISYSQPALFDQYPNVVGGGPLLIRDRQVVLNPQLEGFSKNFIEGSAPRTAVGKMADGTWLIVTMHDRVGGRGPNLTETAQIMQQLGAVDALNLDGGSSSSLYLGGQLLNRAPRTAARVNNGIGLFVLGAP
ncbi:MAG: phosphodiester glycosidase family protein [Phormidesmis sp.]